jgi:hypothetical protein
MKDMELTWWTHDGDRAVASDKNCVLSQREDRCWREAELQERVQLPSTNSSRNLDEPTFIEA